MPRLSTLATPARLAAALAVAGLACSQVTVSVGGNAPTATVAALPPPTAPPPTEALPPTAEAAPPTATPLFFGQLEIIPGRGYVGTLGDYHVVGEVANVSDQWYEFIIVELTYYDGSGNRLATEDGYTTPLALGPGERGVFHISSDVNGAVAEAAAYTYLLQEASAADEPPSTGLEATVDDETAETSSAGTRYAVAGTVVHGGETECTSTAVTVGLYDAGGKIVEVVVTYVDTEPLPPGESGSFEAVTYELAEPYASYRLWTECYTS